MSESITSFRCSACSGNCVSLGGGRYRCLYCGNEFTESGAVTDDGVRRLNDANSARDEYDFARAIGICGELNELGVLTGEASWCALLSKYGVVYIKNDEGKFVPTFVKVNRHAPKIQSDALYANLTDSRKREADEIESMREKVIADFEKVQPYDVFICYKQHGEDGRETPESKWAAALYHRLDKAGLRVFYDEASLKGSNVGWEPQIFAALQSAKFMVVMASSPENLNSRWVKNEWKRFAFQKENGADKSIAVLSLGIEPYLLPSVTLKETQTVSATDGNWENILLERANAACGVKHAMSTDVSSRPKKAAPAKKQPPAVKPEIAKKIKRGMTVALCVCGAVTLAAVLLAVVAVAAPAKVFKYFHWAALLCLCVVAVSASAACIVVLRMYYERKYDFTFTPLVPLISAAVGALSLVFCILSSFGVFTSHINIHIYDIDDVFDEDNIFFFFEKSVDYHLENDLDFKGGDGEKFRDGLHSLDGTFNGNYHTIKNLKSPKGGLFRDVARGALVANLRLENCTFAGDGMDSIGALVNYNYGIIENCSAVGCRVEAQFDYSVSIGGLVGSNSGYVANCEFVNGDGYGISVVLNASTLGNRTVYVGGLIGRDYSENYVNCYSGAKIGVDSRALGVEEAKETCIYVGGIAGYREPNYEGSFLRCINDASVSINGKDVTCKVGSMIGLLEYKYIDHNRRPELENCYTTSLIADMGESKFAPTNGAVYIDAVDKTNFPDDFADWTVTSYGISPCHGFN